MGGVPPLVRHMLMSFREATDRFLTPPTASSFARHGTLQPFQLTLRLS